MPSGGYNLELSIGGVSMSRRVSKTADTQKVYGDAAAPISLAAAKAGTLDTRTDDDTGVVGLATGHGFETGDVVDVYWDGGLRYAMDATVSGDDVTVDGGAGDALPVQTTEVYVSERKQVNVALDGDAVVMVGWLATQRAHVDFQDAATATVRAMELQADEPDTYTEDDAGANPYTGNPITVAYASCGTATAGTLVGVSLEDGTP